MHIAVAGGTGVLGRRVVAALAESGHTVTAISRHEPAHALPADATHARADLATGDGLEAALDGVEAVVDASNAPPSRRKAEPVLVQGTDNLLRAEQRAGVSHHVCVSIVGCDRVPTAYYGVKTRQEPAVEQGPIAWTIVRATQFHDLVASTFESLSRVRVIPAPRFPVQPVAVETVAALVAETAAGEPRRDRVEIAGPALLDFRELARTWRAKTGKRAAVIPLPLPGKLGRALRAGGLTSAEHAAAGTPTFEQWLSEGGANS